MEHSDIVLTYSTVLMSIGFSNIIAYISFNYPYFMRRTISTSGRKRIVYISSWWILVIVFWISIKGLFNLNYLLNKIEKLSIFDNFILSFVVPISYIIIPFHVISIITDLYTVFLKEEVLIAYREACKKDRDWMKVLGRPKFWILNVLQVDEEDFCNNKKYINIFIDFHKYKLFRDLYLLAPLLIFLSIFNHLFKYKIIFYLYIILTIITQSIPNKIELFIKDINNTQNNDVS